MGPILSSSDDVFSGAIIEERNGCVIVKLIDDVLSENVNEFMKLLNLLVKQKKYQMILDFSQIDYICSYGLGMIVTILKKLREQSGDLVLVGVGDWLNNLLTISRINTIIKMFPSLKEALEYFEKRKEEN